MTREFMAKMKLIIEVEPNATRTRSILTNRVRVAFVYIFLSDDLDHIRISYFYNIACLVFPIIITTVFHDIIHAFHYFV